MGCRQGTHPDIAHDPGFRVHIGIEHSRPGDAAAEELAQSRVGADTDGAIVVITNDARPEILIAETKVRRFLTWAILVLLVADELAGSQAIDQFDMRIFNRWRDRQIASVRVGIEDQRRTDLAKIVLAQSKVGLLAKALDRRHEQSNCQRDNGDYD
jgi:hypothetical protein